MERIFGDLGFADRSVGLVFVEEQQEEEKGKVCTYVNGWYSPDGS